MQESGGCVPLASLNDVPLEGGHGAVVEEPDELIFGAHHQCDSRRQLFNRPEHGRAQLIIPSALNPQANGLAVTGAGQP